MILDVIFDGGSNRVFTKSLSQFDRGTKLRFLGVILPSTFEVHFANQQEDGVATVVQGANYIVPIPDAYFVSGEYIYAWVYVHGTKNVNSYDLENEILTATPNSETVPDERKSNSVLEVIIPINRRPVPLSLPEGGTGIDLSEDSLTFGFDSERESLLIGQN